MEKEKLYEATALVAETREHGPMLCFGPQPAAPYCQVPITNWDWEEVEGEERLAGTTLGEYHVLGTFDGDSFTLRDVGEPQWPETEEEDPLTSPCPEPEGGWPVGRGGEGNLQAAYRYARNAQGYAGLWLSNAGPEDVAPGPRIVNAAFTGEVERHEGEMRKLWDGPLCVIRHKRSYGGLQGIQKDLDSFATEHELETLFTDIDIVDNIVELEVVLLTDEALEALEARYGAGAVHARGVLQPVR